MRSITSPAGRVHVAAAVGAATLSPVAIASSTAPEPKPQPKPVPLVVKVDEGGFRWGDAGIGAAGGFGAALVLAGGLALVGRRDRFLPHPPHQKEKQP